MLFDDVLPSIQLASQALSSTFLSLGLENWHVVDAGLACLTVWILLRWVRTSKGQVRTTALRGPPGDNFLYGVGKRVLDADDSGSLYEVWAQEYGPVYAAPSTLGTKKIVLCDPKAIAHYYPKEMSTYIQTPFSKVSLASSFGKGLLWAHGEDHGRQRKSLTPGFSIAAIRQLTSIFYDSAYKAKGAWDALIESNGGEEAMIEVQNWMNYISLDTIGLAGFSHNFGALDGTRASLTEVFDIFGASPRSSALNKRLMLLAQIFPFLMHIPTRRTRLLWKLSSTMASVSKALISRAKKEMEMGVVGGKEEKSIIGLLIKGANNSEFHLTEEEVVSQMKVLLVAGYETTSVSMTWALLELSRNPDIQTKLRNELLEHGSDPSYDQLSNGLPYLDAVVHEILRIHPPVVEMTRVAIEDDVIPLSEPIRTKSGELVGSITIAEGTMVTISMECMNRSIAIWGEDAKVFRPSRWLADGHGEDGIPAKAKEIQGHRHLLTFVDGPRTCLGKNFAVTEFKAVLSVLIKNYVFELRDGVDSKIEFARGMLPRPRLEGEVGCKLPLRVRPYVA